MRKLGLSYRDNSNKMIEPDNCQSNKKNLLKFYYVAGTFLRVLHVLFQLIPTTQ